MMQVTNIYWYPEKTPPDTAIYIGRPSIYGNPFKKSDGIISEYVVAQYWLYIFSKMKNDPGFTAEVMSLQGKDVVCSCKNKHAWKACHGDPLVYLIQRNAQTNWTIGQPIQCSVGIREYHKEIYERCVKHTGEDIWLWFGVMETDLAVTTYTTELQAVKRFKDAAFLLALWSLLLTRLYNEGREMTNDQLDYCTHAIQFYMGRRNELPDAAIARPSARKHKST